MRRSLSVCRVAVLHATSRIGVRTLATAAPGSLLSPATLGPWELKNHLVMAPMTRSRASREGVQPPYAATYYQQRATAGLIITEGTQTSHNAQGYSSTPGIYTDAHVAGWKPVVDAVHGERSRIFVQLMHAGRIAHSANRLTPEAPVAPSAVRANVKLFAAGKGMQPTDEPRELTLNEIRALYDEFAHATKLAISSAGFDGVELHGASGYLPHQFLSSNVNRRTDAYGGSVTGRIRFVVECLQAMIEAAGDSKRVGIKLSPKMGFNDVEDADADELYPALARALTPLNLSYLHVMRSPGVDVIGLVRKHYKGTLIAGGGYDAASGEAALANHDAELIAYGTSYLANPDLPRRFALQAELNKPIPSLFYAPGEKGYTDYPTLPH